MNDLNNLFSHYSLQEIIVFTVAVLFAVEGVWKLGEFFINKIQILVGKKISAHDLEKDRLSFEQDTRNSFQKLNIKIDELNEQNKQTHAQQEQVEKRLALVRERMQENTRSFLIDSHHKFCYQYHKIDDLSLQSIERRYLYYKTDGGDTFIDHLMEEIRSLPRVSYVEDNQL